MRLRDLPLFVDHVRDALGVLVLRARRRAVRHTDLALGVAEEGEGEVELAREALVVFAVVEADAEDEGVPGFVIGVQVPEPGTFQRSARGVGLRVEPEDHLLPAQVVEPDRVAVVILHFEVGSDVSEIEHAFASEQES